MKRILEALKKKNRTILEMDLGILAIGLLLQISCLAFAERKLAWAVSLLIGTALALAAVRHIYRFLDTALDLDAGNAGKMIYKGYLIRYFLLVAVLLLVTATKYLNPLLVLLSYFSLKFAAYLQPLTHRLCNKLFHESDPVPQPMEDDAWEEANRQDPVEGTQSPHRGRTSAEVVETVRDR